MIFNRTRLPRPQFEGSPLILAVMAAFLAVAFLQIRGEWKDAQRGLLIFERTQADRVIDTRLIARAARVRTNSVLDGALARETVMVERRSGRHAFVGAGVIVASAGGSIDVVTAHHVIAHTGTLVVQFRDGSLENGRVLRDAPADDLAVIRLPVPTTSPYAVARLAPQDFATGDSFVVMGHPGLRDWAATPGVVERHVYATLLFCPRCDRGDSGAGAFDMNGRLRGIVVKKLTIEGPSPVRGIVAFTTERPDRIRALLAR